MKKKINLLKISFNFKKSMDYVSCGGINVVLTPGRFNSAYYEHAYLAKKIGAQLVRNEELIVKR